MAAKNRLRARGISTTCLKSWNTSNLISIVALVCCVVLSAPAVSARGRLVEPAQRSSLWTRGFDSPRNNDDSGLNCGGRWVQHGINDGRCGVCGDRFDVMPRDNEPGGRYANGIIANTYTTEDSSMLVVVDVQTFQGGYFEFRICPHNNVQVAVRQECLNRHQLRVWDVESKEPAYRYYPRAEGLQRLRVEIPRGMTCTQCVLQWKWHTSKDWGRCPDGTSRIGCGAQEEFFNCADIAIEPATAESAISLDTPFPAEIAASDMHTGQDQGFQLGFKPFDPTANTGPISFLPREVLQAGNLGPVVPKFDFYDTSAAADAPIVVSSVKNDVINDVTTAVPFLKATNNTVELKFNGDVTGQSASSTVDSTQGGTSSSSVMSSSTSLSSSTSSLATSTESLSVLNNANATTENVPTTTITITSSSTASPSTTSAAASTEDQTKSSSRQHHKHPQDPSTTATSSISSLSGMTSTHADMTSTSGGMSSTQVDVTSTLAGMTSTQADVTSTSAGMTSTHADVTPTTQEVTTTKQAANAGGIPLSPTVLGNHGLSVMVGMGASQLDPRDLVFWLGNRRAFRPDTNELATGSNFNDVITELPVPPKMRLRSMLRTPPARNLPSLRRKRQAPMNIPPPPPQGNVAPAEPTNYIAGGSQPQQAAPSHGISFGGLIGDSFNRGGGSIAQTQFMTAQDFAPKQQRIGNARQATEIMVSEALGEPVSIPAVQSFDALSQRFGGSSIVQGNLFGSMYSDPGGLGMMGGADLMADPMGGPAFDARIPKPPQQSEAELKAAIAGAPPLSSAVSDTGIQLDPSALVGAAYIPELMEGRSNQAETSTAARHGTMIIAAENGTPINMGGRQLEYLSPSLGTSLVDNPWLVRPDDRSATAIKPRLTAEQILSGQTGINHATGSLDTTGLEAVGNAAPDSGNAVPALLNSILGGSISVTDASLDPSVQKTREDLIRQLGIAMGVMDPLGSGPKPSNNGGLFQSTISRGGADPSMATSDPALAAILAMTQAGRKDSAREVFADTVVEAPVLNQSQAPINDQSQAIVDATSMGTAKPGKLNTIQDVISTFMASGEQSMGSNAATSLSMEQLMMGISAGDMGQSAQPAAAQPVVDAADMTMEQMMSGGLTVDAQASSGTKVSGVGLDKFGQGAKSRDQTVVKEAMKSVQKSKVADVSGQTNQRTVNVGASDFDMFGLGSMDPSLAVSQVSGSPNDVFGLQGMSMEQMMALLNMEQTGSSSSSAASSSSSSSSSVGASQLKSAGSTSGVSGVSAQTRNVVADRTAKLAAATANNKQENTIKSQATGTLSSAGFDQVLLGDVANMSTSPQSYQDLYNAVLAEMAAGSTTSVEPAPRATISVNIATSLPSSSKQASQDWTAQSNAANVGQNALWTGEPSPGIDPLFGMFGVGMNSLDANQMNALFARAQSSQQSIAASQAQASAQQHGFTQAEAELNAIAESSAIRSAAVPQSPFDATLMGNMAMNNMFDPYPQTATEPTISLADLLGGNFPTDFFGNQQAQTQSTGWDIPASAPEYRFDPFLNQWVVVSNANQAGSGGAGSADISISTSQTAIGNEFGTEFAGMTDMTALDQGMSSVDVSMAGLNLEAVSTASVDSNQTKQFNKTSASAQINDISFLQNGHELTGLEKLQSLMQSIPTSTAGVEPLPIVSTLSSSKRSATKTLPSLAPATSSTPAMPTTSVTMPTTFKPLPNIPPEVEASLSPSDRELLRMERVKQEQLMQKLEAQRLELKRLEAQRKEQEQQLMLEKQRMDYERQQLLLRKQQMELEKQKKEQLLLLEQKKQEQLQQRLQLEQERRQLDEQRNLIQLEEQRKKELAHQQILKQQEEEKRRELERQKVALQKQHEERLQRELHLQRIREQEQMRLRQLEEQKQQELKRQQELERQMELQRQQELEQQRIAKEQADAATAAAAAMSANATTKNSSTDFTPIGFVGGASQSADQATIEAWQAVVRAAQSQGGLGADVAVDPYTQALQQQAAQAEALRQQAIQQAWLIKQQQQQQRIQEEASRAQQNDLLQLLQQLQEQQKTTPAPTTTTTTTTPAPTTTTPKPARKAPIRPDPETRNFVRNMFVSAQVPGHDPLTILVGLTPEMLMKAGINPMIANSADMTRIVPAVERTLGISLAKIPGLPGPGGAPAAGGAAPANPLAMMAMGGAGAPSLPANASPAERADARRQFMLQQRMMQEMMQLLGLGPEPLEPGDPGYRGPGAQGGPGAGPGRGRPHPLDGAGGGMDPMGGGMDPMGGGMMGGGMGAHGGPGGAGGAGSAFEMLGL